VLKATLMRVTLHLVTAREFHLFRAAIDTVGQSRWSSALVAAGDDLELIREALHRRAGQGPLPRAEALRMISALVPGMAELDRNRLWYLLKSERLVNDPRWALLGSRPSGDHVLGPARVEVSPAAAATHLVRAHLAAFGPASRADTAEWSGQTVGSLQPGYAALAGELVEFTGPAGERLLDLRDAPRPPAETPAPVRFLAKWDSLLLGHSRRQRVISGPDRRVVIRKNGDVTESFTVNGFVAGTWAVTQSRGKAALQITTFGRIAKPARRDLHQEGERLLRFLAPDATTRVIEEGGGTLSLDA